MAVVYVLGVCVSAGECGSILRWTMGILLICLLFHGVKTKKLRMSALALLCVLFLAGGLRYRLSKQAFQRSEERIQLFSGLRVRLCGELQEYTEAEGKAKLRLRNCTLSSAYGRKESLPISASEQMRARYDQPVGTILVYLDASEIRPLPGELLEVYGKISPMEAARNEGEFDFRLYYRTQSVHGTMYGTEASVVGGEPKPFAEGLQKLRLQIGSILDQLLPPQDAGIYRALLTGDKSAMDEDIRSLYQDAGIAHILAVSGLHLSILGVGMYELLRRFGGSKAFSGALAALIIVSYGILTGSSGSALRAVIMLLLRFLGAAAGRSYDMLSALATAALLLLWKEPYMLFGSGFQLSFLAVLSIGLCAMLPSPKKPLLNSLWTSLYLQLLTLPIILFHYFRFPLYGIFLNLIVLPLMSSVVYSGIFGVVLFLVSPWAAAVAIGGGHTILRLYTLLCTQCARLPLSSLLLGRPSMPCILLYYAALALATLRLMRQEKCKKESGNVEKPSLHTVRKEQNRVSDPLPGSLDGGNLLRRLPLPIALLSLLLALYALPAKPPQGLEITALDVGQGDGFVLRHQDVVMTVDGGSTSNKSLGKNVLLPYLESQGIDYIDLALITHCDADHYSGILYLLEEEEHIRIGELLLPRVAEHDTRYDALREAAEARGTQLRYVGSGDMLRFGDVELRAYYPVGVEPIQEANAHSIGMLLRYQDFQMLFTGDMDETCEAVLLGELARTGERANASIDVLKVGHHGSHTSTSEALLEALQPETALLSYGVGNDYGHPHAETLERLTRYGVRMLKTGELGEIRITVPEKPAKESKG